ncbi:MAG: N-acetylmuramoyl-L-alanine amidase [Alphaproteobacteria bacterium]|nr:N-acetylmuramoyl-L-alanine amidase [Alphaproteobacteria bacterium]
MRFNRRDVLKISGFSVVAMAMLPRMAFAARNSLRSMRTGVQPGNKTRLVIETATRPSYSLSYPANQLVVNLSNTSANTGASTSWASGTLVKSVAQVQSGDTLQVVVNLKQSISALQKSNIMLLEPNGDNDYRLVLDFVAGAAPAVATKSAKSLYGTIPSEPVHVAQPTTTYTTAAATPTTAITAARKYIVVVDAGHGGKDPGCIGKGGTREKDIVLSVAKKLKSKLDINGFKTYLTRDGDKYLKLAERASIAESRHADLFISLHANANPSRKMKGFSIYTLSEKASDEEAKKLAEAENAADKIGVEGFTEFEENIRIALSSLQQHAVAEMSEEYATGCAKSFKKASITQQPGPDVRHAPFAVLRSTVPGALLEIGHLSNPDEEKLLKSGKHQDKIVDAIVRSVKNYNFEV